MSAVSRYCHSIQSHGLGEKKTLTALTPTDRLRPTDEKQKSFIRWT
jgi:hypothetical protein